MSSLVKSETKFDQPRAMSIPRAMEWSGLSRSAIYRAAGEGTLTLLKAGRTTLVDGPSIAALVDSLPAAKIAAPRPGKLIA